MRRRTKGRMVAGIDLFCGAGGLTYGLQKAGISMVAGIDVDPACEYPFTSNNNAKFIKKDIRAVEEKELSSLYPRDAIRLLAGCAPCRPFSSFRRGTYNCNDDEWGLLKEFARLVGQLKPDLVTMENVPGLASKPMFRRFVTALKEGGYEVDYRSVYCPPFGIPQHRRRLVLVASTIGRVRVPVGTLPPTRWRTVRDAIAGLPTLESGKMDNRDPLHKARSLSKLNALRMQNSRPGGTWHDWNASLRAKCHQRKSGRSYQSVYSRMVWDEPSPTITTQAYSFGTGRFGHPQQDRSLTLREAAILQSFPHRYRFVKPRENVYFLTIGRLIGNAVPPRLGYFIGKELIRVASTFTKLRSINR